VPKKILNYISSLVLCLTVFTANAEKKIIEPKDTIKTPFYSGFIVQGDIISLATSVIGNSETYSYEGAIQVDLKHKFYPIIEVGYAGADRLSTVNNVGFKTDAPFARVGIDFNLIKKKPNSKPNSSLFIAGLRFGMTKFNYSLTNLTITDEYWGGSESVYTGSQSSTRTWWEIVAGVRVEVIKNVYMGWTVRNKNQISSDVAGAPAPWYIPGFGTNTSSHWGFNYTIGYHF